MVDSFFTRCRQGAVFCSAAAVACACVLGTAAACQAQQASAEEVDLVKLVTPAARQSVDRGLAWLAKRQQKSGAFGSGRLYRQNVGVTAFAGMAFLSGGHTPGRGRYGAEVEKCVGFVLASAGPDGFISVKESASNGPMYSHGFATLFLAEVYGMSRRDDVHEHLSRAVRVIIDAQNNEGGWRYLPVPRDADISVTVCQMVALRAARNAGIAVPKETIDKGVAYIQKCQNADGGFRYQLERRAESLFPRSAAALVALFSSGIYEGEEIDRGMHFVMRYLPDARRRYSEGYYFYGHYYAAQATWLAGPEQFETWYPAIRNELLQLQQADGRWVDTSYTDEYATAMSTIILQVPNGYLPIFQR